MLSGNRVCVAGSFEDTIRFGSQTLTVAPVAPAPNGHGYFLATFTDATLDTAGAVPPRASSAVRSRSNPGPGAPLPYPGQQRSHTSPARTARRAVYAAKRYGQPAAGDGIDTIYYVTTW